MTEPLDPATVSAKLCAFVGESLLARADGFDEHSRLKELGLDSFSLVEMLLFCERTFGVIVPESRLTRDNLESVAALSRIVSELAGPHSPIS